MSSKFVQHWLLLVEAIYLSLQDEISEEDLEAADAMLRIFLTEVGPLYGDEQYTYKLKGFFCEKRYASTPLGIEPRSFRLPVECSVI